MIHFPAGGHNLCLSIEKLFIDPNMFVVNHKNVGNTKINIVEEKAVSCPNKRVVSSVYELNKLKLTQKHSRVHLHTVRLA